MASEYITGAKNEFIGKRRCHEKATRAAEAGAVEAGEGVTEERERDARERLIRRDG